MFGKLAYWSIWIISKSVPEGNQPTAFCALLLLAMVSLWQWVSLWVSLWQSVSPWWWCFSVGISVTVLPSTPLYIGHLSRDNPLLACRRLDRQNDLSCIFFYNCDFKLLIIIRYTSVIHCSGACVSEPTVTRVFGVVMHGFNKLRWCVNVIIFASEFRSLQWYADLISFSLQGRLWTKPCVGAFPQWCFLRTSWCLSLSSTAPWSISTISLFVRHRRPSLLTRHPAMVEAVRCPCQSAPRPPAPPPHTVPRTPWQAWEGTSRKPSLRVNGPSPSCMVSTRRWKQEADLFDECIWSVDCNGSFWRYENPTGGFRDSKYLIFRSSVYRRSLFAFQVPGEIFVTIC